MDREDMVRISAEYTTQPRKERHTATGSHVGATNDDHTKWSKSERERQITYDITYMRNLHYNTDEGKVQIVEKKGPSIRFESCT